MTIIILVIVVLSIIWMILIYNQLVKEKNLIIKEAWSGINIQVKRRHNLIPALVKTVKAYCTNERKLFNEITEKRTKSVQIGNIISYISSILIHLFIIN